MGMHEWMACLQLDTLVPGLGLGLDQPNLHLAQPLLDDDLNTPNSTTKTSQNTPNQPSSNHTHNLK